jgi:hypothetical protein
MPEILAGIAGVFLRMGRNWDIFLSGTKKGLVK